MKQLNKNRMIGFAAIGFLSFAQGVQAEPSNPMLICVYTSSKLPGTAADIAKLIGVGVSTYSTVRSGNKYWTKTYAVNIPVKGTRVCSPQFSGSQGWSDASFAYTAPLTYDNMMRANSGYTKCEARNLVTSRSQIGYGIEYALHYSILGVAWNGSGLVITKCVVSNVDLDS